MNKVSGYNVYQNNYYDQSVKNRKETNKTSKTDSAKKTNSTQKTGNNPVQLSEKAKALLQELKKTYSNMDFMVADYDSEEEAASYLSRGTKEYSVLIDAEELERMAADDDVKKQNLSLLDEAVGKLDEVKDQLGDHKDEVMRIGISIGKDGEMSFFAELEKVSERQKEFVDKIRDGKKEAAEKAESNKTDSHQAHHYNYDRSKRTTVYASTAEELIEKISNVDWDSIKEETSLPTPGGHFNYSI
ncbi:MAG: hypothetical protein K2J99_17595 [Lachnospiraceae bacterium]|nr:hypothetical protein [Lachnospiraceae bacterium]